MVGEAELELERWGSPATTSSLEESLLMMYKYDALLCVPPYLQAVPYLSQSHSHHILHSAPLCCFMCTVIAPAV